MKKIYTLLIAALAVGTMSCEKVILKETTLQLDFSQVESEFQYDGNSKYLYDMAMEDFIRDYTIDLADHLGTGRIDIVESGADYVLVVNDIDLVESVENERVGLTTYELSKLTLKTEMMLMQQREDLPVYFEVESEIEESVHCPETGEVDALEMENLLCLNLGTTRSKIRKVMVRNQ